MSKYRIKCPSTDFPKEKRIDLLLNELSNWMRSEPLIKLIELFGENVPEELSDYEYIKWLNTFAEENWDYRAKLGKDNERWNIKNEIPTELSDNLFQLLENLGVLEPELPIKKPDFILPLGGARYSNYDRPILVKNIISELNLKNIFIVGLSTNRPLNTIENEYTSEYAPFANTEFDALSSGLQKAFNLNNDTKHDLLTIKNQNPNIDLIIRELSNKEEENRIFVLCSPSSDSERRANSRDTFEFFLEKFHLKENESVLLCTTNLYVPYQLLAFIDLAIENNFYVDCIGNKPDGQNNPTIFLQEIKATINQVFRLFNKYY